MVAIGVSLPSGYRIYRGIGKAFRIIRVEEVASSGLAGSLVVNGSRSSLRVAAGMPGA